MTTTDDTAPEQFTPTDEQVKAEWIASLSTPDPDNYWDAISEEEAQARWSRWLAAHDARVRRDAWQEGYDRAQAVHCDAIQPCDVTTPNPYEETP